MVMVVSIIITNSMKIYIYALRSPPALPTPPSCLPVYMLARVPISPTAYLTRGGWSLMLFAGALSGSSLRGLSGGRGGLELYGKLSRSLWEVVPRFHKSQEPRRRLLETT